MSDELLKTKNRQKQKEEIRTKLKENWDEISYFDVLFHRTWELIIEKEEYNGLAAWDVLDYEFIDYDLLLRKGRVKDWVGLFEEYHREMKSKDGYGSLPYGYSDEFLEPALEGLVRTLEQGDIFQKDREKLNPFLHEEIKDMLTIEVFDFGAFGCLHELYWNLVEAVGLIGSGKSVPFLKKVIEWVDKHPCEEIGQHGEQKYDYSHNVRCAAVEALVRITGDEEAEFLYKRFHEDGSPSVQKTIYNELVKMTSDEVMRYVRILRNMVPFHDAEDNFGEFYHFPKNAEEELERNVIVELEQARKDEGFFDTLYYKAISMSNNKEFAGIDPLKVLEGYFDLKNFLKQGEVKDIVSLFEEYFRRLDEYVGSKGPFAFSSIDEFLKYAVEGLVKKLERGEMSQEEREKELIRGHDYWEKIFQTELSSKEKDKLAKLLLNSVLTFELVTNEPIGFQKIERYSLISNRLHYCNIIKVIGLIGSRESIPFLKSIIEWIDKHDWKELTKKWGEHKGDFTSSIRYAAVEALVRITGAEEADYLYKRMFKDCSRSVRSKIYKELENIGTKKAKKYTAKIRNIRPGRKLDDIFSYPNLLFEEMDDE